MREDDTMKSVGALQELEFAKLPFSYHPTQPKNYQLLEALTRPQE